MQGNLGRLNQPKLRSAYNLPCLLPESARAPHAMGAEEAIHKLLTTLSTCADIEKACDAARRAVEQSATPHSCDVEAVRRGAATFVEAPPSAPRRVAIEDQRRRLLHEEPGRAKSAQ